ncbi:MAG: hypothetical protein R3B06_16800 [Kofleriaceae bacterium]
MRTVTLVLLSALVGSLGCQVGDVGGVAGGPSTGDDDPLPTPACDGPFGSPRDPSTLPTCCTDFVGGAHCLPDDTVPGVLRDKFAACAGGGTCVPDPFIATGGVYQPKSCTSLQGADGVCLSGCIPQVADVWGILPQEACADSERCVPCINPLDGQDTGACNLRYTCEGGFGGGGACPHTGPDLIDPANLPACGPDAHCLSLILVPDEMRSRLAECPASTDKCVPDDFIRTGGAFVPATCASVGGAEGRCLSKVLPEIAAQANLLQQGTCGDNEVCAPCWNPLDQTDTGACHLSCDPGPTMGPTQLPACCDGRGTCVPTSAAGANADRLGQDTCTDDGMVCAPNVFLEPGFVPATCETGLIQNLFGSRYAEGRCLPDCLPDVANFLIGQDGCADGMKCAPCLKPPFGTNSGACDPIMTGP